MSDTHRVLDSVCVWPYTQGIDAYALDVLAADVAEVVKALGHDKCVLVGHDW